MIDASRIKELGREFGVDVIRITSADPFPSAHEQHLEQIKSGLYTDRKHRHLKDLDVFYSPGQKIPGARSIIAAAQCYLTDESSDTGKFQGSIARYTRRNNYKDLKQRLEKIARSISDHKWFCASNGPVAEKPIARRSGVGYYGKHSIIINPDYGSWIVLGEIITTLDIEPDDTLPDACGQCDICIQTCPTRAIIKPYFIDRSRCIQELTNWTGMIPEDIAQVWGDRLYGCTACQDMCPVNVKVPARAPRTNIGHVGASYSALSILQMDEDHYRREFADNQMSADWINFNAIQRNALLVLGHYRDRTTLPTIEKFTGSSDPLLSCTASWILKRF